MFVLAVALPARKNYAQENNSRICLVSVLLKFGCSREGELRGDIFIVTNSAANIKLGLVEVSAIAEKDMSDFLVNRSKVVDTEIARTQEEYDTIKAQFDEASRQYLQARKWAQEEVTRNLSGGDFSWSDANRAFDKATVLDKIRPKLDSAELALAYARSAAPWFEGMPKAVITASTDGDGKFSMKLPTSGKFAIVAHASRQVFSTKEEYYWIVWTSLEGEALTNVTLSNKNLLLGEDDIKAQVRPGIGIFTLAATERMSLVDSAQKVEAATILSVLFWTLTVLKIGGMANS